MQQRNLKLHKLIILQFKQQELNYKLSAHSYRANAQITLMLFLTAKSSHSIASTRELIHGNYLRLSYWSRWVPLVRIKRNSHCMYKV